MWPKKKKKGFVACYSFVWAVISGLCCFRFLLPWSASLVEKKKMLIYNSFKRPPNFSCKKYLVFMVTAKLLFYIVIWISISNYTHTKQHTNTRNASLHTRGNTTQHYSQNTRTHWKHTSETQHSASGSQNPQTLNRHTSKTQRSAISLQNPWTLCRHPTRNTKQYFQPTTPTNTHPTPIQSHYPSQRHDLTHLCLPSSPPQRWRLHARVHAE